MDTRRTSEAAKDFFPAASAARTGSTLQFSGLLALAGQDPIPQPCRRRAPGGRPWTDPNCYVQFLTTSHPYLPLLSPTHSKK